MADDKTGKAQGDEAPRRPNAKYKLSTENQTEENMVFHYNREARLAKAPPEVQALYDESSKPRPSLMRSLVDTKGKMMLFGSLVVMCIGLLIYSIADSPGSSSELEGNIVSVQAFKFDDNIIVKLTKKIKKNAKTPYTGAVNVAAFEAKYGMENLAAMEAAGTMPPMYINRFYFSNEDIEEYRFSLPFEAEQVIFLIETEKSQIQLKQKVE